MTEIAGGYNVTVKDRLFLAAATELGLLQLNHGFFHEPRPARPAPSPPAQGGLLTPQQLARHIGTSSKFVYEHLNRKRNANPLPHYKIGKFVRFKLEEVERWLATQQH